MCSTLITKTINGVRYKESKEAGIAQALPSQTSHYTACHIVTFQDFCVGGSKGKVYFIFDKAQLRCEECLI